MTIQLFFFVCQFSYVLAEEGRDMSNDMRDNQKCFQVLLFGVSLLLKKKRWSNISKKHSKEVPGSAWAKIKVLELNKLGLSIS